MKKLLALLLLQLVFGNECFAKDPPPFLFHWTTPGSLRWMMENNPDPSLVPMQSIASTKLSVAYPDLEGVRGTFAWIHPTSGMSAGRKEIYAKLAKDGRPPILLSMQPDPSASVIELTTHPGMKPVHNPEILKYDFIFHTRVDLSGKELYKEWVVLNPKKIRAFTADPSVVRKVLESEIARMRSIRAPQLSRDLVHFPMKVSPRTDKTLEVYLKNGTEGIPPSMLNRPFPEVPLFSSEYEYPSLGNCFLNLLRKAL